jgi:hypothetical protein
MQISASSRRLVLVLPVLFLGVLPLKSQDRPGRTLFPTGDPFALVGMRLEDLIGRFGPPQAVYALRGPEEWQDDVVFVYSEGDFYVAKDRVWQVGLKSVYSLKLGDPRAAALLVLGEEAQDRGDYALRPFTGGSGAWPLTLRVNFNGAGLVSAIFIYRPDF